MNNIEPQSPLIDELFSSPIRVAVDNEIRSIIMTQVDDESLRLNLLYHLHLDTAVKPTLEFSKRLRAYLCYLFAQESATPLNEIIPLATSVELLHNSTLAVDDIQDNSDRRCGRYSLWKKVGIPSALNAAYFLGLYSLQYYQEKRKLFNYYDHTSLITQFIERLLCGQQMDLDSNKLNSTIENYYAIVYGKTGALLNLACLLGYMPYSYCPEKAQLITNFSNSLAICYQIIDDMNDIKNGLILDSSNILNFIVKNAQPNEKNIHEIEGIKNSEMNKLLEIIQRLHIVGILKSYQIDKFVDELIM